MLTGWDQCKIHGHDRDAIKRGLGYQNPRLKHLCPRCNRPLSSGAMQRDLAHERMLTLEASQFVRGISAASRGAVSEALSSYAESRAGAGPWRDFDERDFSVEAAEEIADLRMYVLAEMTKWEQRRDAGRDDEDADAELMHLRRALAAAVECYDAVSSYRRVRDD